MSPTSLKPSTPWYTAKCYFASCRRATTLLVLVSLVLVVAVLYFKCYSGNDETFIVVITPTHKRKERLADMTRFSQTLMHVKNLMWVVIEDGNETNPMVSRLLNRTHIPYVYLHTTTERGYPKRGWSQRNLALEFLRSTFKNYKGNAVVYFADDDNAYDLRVFDYIRQVETIGLWAVGFAGQALVEAPRVENDTITGWDVYYYPKRKFATDMAGFA
ncbi:Protein GLCT-2, partial [Aphelenchoides avenae]